MLSFMRGLFFFFFIGFGCQKLVFFLALVKLHNLRLRFADGVRVSQAPQTRRFRPFCSVAYSWHEPSLRLRFASSQSRASPYRTEPKFLCLWASSHKEIGFCSARLIAFAETRYAQTVLQHLRLLTKLGKNLLSSACVCLTRTPSANCYLIVVQFDKCNLGYVLLTP